MIKLERNWEKKFLKRDTFIQLSPHPKCSQLAKICLWPLRFISLVLYWSCIISFLNTHPRYLLEPMLLTYVIPFFNWWSFTKLSSDSLPAFCYSSPFKFWEAGPRNQSHLSCPRWPLPSFVHVYRLQYVTLSKSAWHQWRTWYSLRQIFTEKFFLNISVHSKTEEVYTGFQIYVGWLMAFEVRRQKEIYIIFSHLLQIQHWRKGTKEAQKWCANILAPQALNQTVTFTAITLPLTFRCLRATCTPSYSIPVQQLYSQWHCSWLQKLKCQYVFL